MMTVSDHYTPLDNGKLYYDLVQCEAFIVGRIKGGHLYGLSFLLDALPLVRLFFSAHESFYFFLILRIFYCDNTEQ
jgi:hypothetical protein